MTDETRVDRRGVSREDLARSEEAVLRRIADHEKLDDTRFASMEKFAEERHRAVTDSLTAIRTNAHNLANKLTPIFALPDRMDAMEGELKDVPRKEDLTHLSQTIHTRFDTFEETQAREKAEASKRTGNLLKVIGIAAPFAIVGLNILAKKMGWL